MCVCSLITQDNVVQIRWNVSCAYSEVGRGMFWEIYIYRYQLSAQMMPTKCQGWPDAKSGRDY